MAHAIVATIGDLVVLVLLVRFVRSPFGANHLTIRAAAILWTACLHVVRTAIVTVID